MNQKFYLASFFALLLCLSFHIKASAQTNSQIQGTVVGEDKLPLPGVSIIQKGTSTGVTSDANGEYSINISGSQGTLVFSFMGYVKKEEPVNGRATINVSLEPDIKSLDEVVVVAYGTALKKDLTGAIGTLSGDLLTRSKTTRVSQALQGAIAGVSVTRSSGAPGAQSTIRIRGITTLGVNDPLVIVDGVPGNIDNISPDDIENISVLKDAASSAIYGSRAAAGVILISTKRAKDGQSTITYSSDFGIQKATAMPSFVDAPTYMRLFNEMKVNDGQSPIYDANSITNFAALNAAEPDKYPNTDWQKSYFRDKAFQQRHNLDISLGTRNLRSKVSLGYIDQDVLERNRSFNRYTLRVNNDLTINKNLSAKVDFAYYMAQALAPATGDINLVRQLPAIYDDYYSDGRYALGKDGANPVANNIMAGGNKTRNNQFNARLQLNYTPLKGLKLTGIFAPQLGFIIGERFSRMVYYTALNDPSLITNTFNTTNALTKSETYNQAINTQFLANYQITVAKDHDFTALLGYENNTFRDESSSLYRDGYVLPDYQVIDAGAKNNWSNGGNATESALRSYFGRIDYNYQHKYLLQTNFRYDGSSKFAKENRWGFFPSVSAGWVVTEESFFKDKTPLSFLKVRASWGRNGNQQIGNYSYQALINLSSTIMYNAAGVVVPVVTGNQLEFANKDKSWETKEDYNLGLDMSFFKNRLNVSADYFNKNTYDILLNLPIPLNLGLIATTQNAASLYNNGWELQVGWHDEINKDWNYSVSANLSDYTNKIKDLKGTSNLGDQALLEGQPFNVWYGYKNIGYFKDAADVAASAKLSGAEKPGDIKYLDVNQDGKISADKDRQVLGNSLPRYLYGGNVSVNYKNIDFGFSFQGVGEQLGKQAGYMVQPFQANFGNVSSYIVDNYWTPTNTTAKYPRLSYNSQAVNYANSDFWLFNASYFRLKDITLGYTFEPKTMGDIGIKGLRVFVSATDLLYISNYPKGWDPEGNQSENPMVKTFYGGLSITF